MCLIIIIQKTYSFKAWSNDMQKIWLDTNLKCSGIVATSIFRVVNSEAGTVVQLLLVRRLIVNFQQQTVDGVRIEQIADIFGECEAFWTATPCGHNGKTLTHGLNSLVAFLVVVRLQINRRRSALVELHRCDVFARIGRRENRLVPHNVMLAYVPQSMHVTPLEHLRRWRHGNSCVSISYF